MTDKDSDQEKFVVRPFDALKSLKNELPAKGAARKQKAKAGKQRPESERSPLPADPAEDMAAFEEAMSDVVPLANRERVASKVGHAGVTR